MTEEVKQLIGEAKNICLIPSENEGDSLSAALALFYTLKELGKNVNLTIENFPEKLNFLIPSLNFISSPKNFVISVPKSIADVSQIYYEKNDENLKIHLTIDKGFVKKEDISFYFSDARPDLLITLGVKNFEKELSSRLDSFGFILDTPIVNIDSSAPPTADDQENTKFGKINIVEQKSISEIILETIQSIDEKLIKKDVSNCILAGLIIYYENFKNAAPYIFELVSELMAKGGDYRYITDELNKTTQKEVNFISKIFQGLKAEGNGILVSALYSDDFADFSKVEATMAVEKLNAIGIKNDLLVLWKGHGSGPITKGFFYSKKPHLISKIADQNQTAQKDWVFLSIIEPDVNLAKNQIIKILAVERRGAS